MSEPLRSHIRYNDFVNASYTLNKMKAQNKFVPKFEFVDNNTSVGIEVEVEQILTHNPVGTEFLYAEDNATKIAHFALWHNKEDGSLRNNGREFVSHPISGENIEFALQLLNRYLHSNANCKGHEFTDRTSVHIHVDFREATFDDVANLLLTYVAVEPVLYNFCGGRRHKNIFCVPVNQTAAYRGLRRFFKLRNIDTFRNLHEWWRKYLGLNLRPLGDGSHFGTIEFRHMVGNIDVDRLCNWINLLLRLKQYAKNTDFEANYAEVTNLNTTSEYANYVSKVLGQNVDLFFPHIQQRMEEMVLFIKSCSVPSVAHSEWTKLPVYNNFVSLFKNEDSTSFKKLKEAGAIAEVTKSTKGKVSIDAQANPNFQWDQLVARARADVDIAIVDEVAVPNQEAPRPRAARPRQEIPFIGPADPEGRTETMFIRNIRYHVGRSTYHGLTSLIREFRDEASQQFNDVINDRLYNPQPLNRLVERLREFIEWPILYNYAVSSINSTRRLFRVPEIEN